MYKRQAYIGINQSHLSCFIVVFVMHIMDHVQSAYIQMRQPVHHHIIFLDDFIIIQIFGGNASVFRSYLLSGLLINTAVDGVQEAFCQVCTGTEELDLFTGLCCRYAAADGVCLLYTSF